jgi:hypothetical protein
MFSSNKKSAAVTTQAETHSELSETTPLNENNLQRVQPVKPQVTSSLNMDAETKKVLTKIIIDVVLLCCGELIVFTSCAT